MFSEQDLTWSSELMAQLGMAEKLDEILLQVLSLLSPEVGCPVIAELHECLTTFS
jgi:hypothetical protein